MYNDTKTAKDRLGKKKVVKTDKKAMTFALKNKIPKDAKKVMGKEC